MGKTSHLFKKTGDIKGIFHVRMGMIKDRNGKDITEAEEIKKRRQEYPELYEKGLNGPDNHDGVIIHLEPDILEYEGKKPLGRITTNKASEGDGIPAEPFQILKDDAVKVLNSICQQIWETRQWLQDYKRPVFHSNPKEGQYQRVFKLPYNCIHFSASNIMLKILQVRLQQYVNQELSDIQLS